MRTYLRHKIVNVVGVKELIALEYLDFCGKYKDYTESHGFWEICFSESGEIGFRLNGEKRVLLKGEVLFVPPHAEHSYTADSNEARAFVICFESPSVTLKPLGGISMLIGKEENECIKKIIGESERTFRMSENGTLETVENPNFGGQQAILLQLEYLLICVLRSLAVEKNSDIVFLDEKAFYADLSDVIIGFFRENIKRKLTLKEICEKLNYSPSFLCNTFRKQTGETLFACFNRMKIEEAKRMLEEGDMSASAVSRELGFSEPKYFGALFKRLVGVSPAVYQKQHHRR